MPTVMNRSHPVFRVHDRHPMLHGLSWLVICLLLLIAFLMAVVPGAWALLLSQDSTGPAAQLHG